MNLLKKLGFFTAFILPALVVTGYYLDGGWNFLAIVFSFILLPLIDQYTGIDTSNDSESVAKIKGEEFYYRFVTYVWTYFQIGFVLWGCYIIGTGNINTTIEWIGFVISFAWLPEELELPLPMNLGIRNLPSNDSTAKRY